MRKYTQLLVLAVLLLLAAPFAVAAGNDSANSAATDSVANSQNDNDANQDRVSYSDDDDDGDSDDDDDGDSDDDDDGDSDDDDDGDYDDDDDGYDDDDDGYDDDDDGYDDDDDDGYYDDDDDDDYNNGYYDDNRSPSSGSSSGRPSSGASSSSSSPSSSSSSSSSSPSSSSSGSSSLASGSGSAASSNLLAANASCQAFSQTGFSACDDSNAGFLSAVQYYGLQNVGYPISERYRRDGFITQAFQKAILQWRADSNSVAFVNVFDELHNAGLDQELYQRRQTPRPLPDGWDGNASFEQVVQKRQALLTRPALRATYFSATDPLTFFGLPTSEVQDMGNHYAIRLQRVVLQEWKNAVPWAEAGQVTVANGGDIAKEFGYLPY